MKNKSLKFGELNFISHLKFIWFPEAAQFSQSLFILKSRSHENIFFYVCIYFVGWDANCIMEAPFVNPLFKIGLAEGPFYKLFQMTLTRLPFLLETKFKWFRKEEKKSFLGYI